MAIELTEKQREAKALAQSEARFVLLRGGSRSGKTFAACYFIFQRAMITPKSRHMLLRKTAVDARRKLFELSFKDMLEIAAPGLWATLHFEGKIKLDDMRIELPNGSVVLFDGLDDSTRQDRILGEELSTCFVSEITQFPNFDIIQKLISRLSLEKEKETGGTLSPKLFLDCNPTSKRHWSFSAFVEKLNPIDRSPWPRPREWGELLMNPADNREHISSTYEADLAKPLGPRSPALPTWRMAER